MVAPSTVSVMGMKRERGGILLGSKPRLLPQL